MSCWTAWTGCWPATASPRSCSPPSAAAGSPPGGTGSPWPWPAIPRRCWPPAPRSPRSRSRPGRPSASSTPAGRGRPGCSSPGRTGPCSATPTGWSRAVGSPGRWSGSGPRPWSRRRPGCWPPGPGPTTCWTGCSTWSWKPTAATRRTTWPSSACPGRARGVRRRTAVAARTELTLTLELRDGRVRISVKDRSKAPPTLRHYQADALTGRGLGVVAALSDSWGVSAAADGKVVWAEVAASADPAGAGAQRPPEEVSQVPAAPAAAAEGLRTVRFPAVPVDGYLALQAHNDALFRELELVSIELETAGPSRVVPPLAELVGQLYSRFRGQRDSYRDVVAAAQARGDATVDLETKVPPAAAGPPRLPGARSGPTSCAATASSSPLSPRPRSRPCAAGSWRRWSPSSRMPAMASYTVNQAAVARARALIDARQYVLNSDWGDAQPNADDENKFLESHSWDDYALWHLGLTDGANDGTKARYAFVYGDFRRVHRTGLIACQYRAAEWRHKQVELAAHDLLQHLDEVSA